jgi:hypothetical protein
VAGRALVIEKKMLLLRKNFTTFLPKKNKAMQQTMEEIKAQCPDEWMILGDPVMSDDDQRVLAAELLYHSADKRALVDMDKPLMKIFKRHAILFNRVTPRNLRHLIGGRTLYSTTITNDDVPHTPLKSIYQ